MFDVLDRNLNLHHHHVLEASAGTGKTFSIENIIVRLLIDDLEIQNILVVTFTKAAAYDLKVRIRQNINKALEAILSLLKSQTLTDIPDYLQAIGEQGIDPLKAAKKKLEKALFDFDRAQIFTIHSFCMRMLQTFFLEGDLALFALSEEKNFTQLEILQVIRDFFRLKMDPKIYGKAHFLLLLNQYDSIEQLEKDLLNMVTKGIQIAPSPTFTELFEAFKQAMQTLKDRGFSSKAIMEDFIYLSSFYNGLLDRKKNLKTEIWEKVSRFAFYFDQDKWEKADFEAIIADQLHLVKLLDPSKRNKKEDYNPQSLQLPDLSTILKQLLGPLVNPLNVFAKLCQDCQKFLKNYQLETEKLRYDDLLVAMQKAIQNEIFAAKIRENYPATLIDEFQDTDPIQWQIFASLFLDTTYTGALYLVGDPKQSIYAFRQADIYTYLAAANAIGADNKASLTTNYRSHPDLINALNALFHESTTPDLIFLPSLHTALPYQPVQASTRDFPKTIADNLGAVHFICSADKQKSLEDLEDTVYFPFIAQELLKLVQSSVFKYRDCALLVSDRFQAQRIMQFLKQYEIPAYCQRQNSLADSPARTSLRQLLQGILYSKHASSLKIALGGKILGWEYTKVTLLDDLAFYEKTLGEINHLRRILLQEGFAAFYWTLMYQPLFESSSTISEQLLHQQNGELFFEELEQIAELLIDKQYASNCSPESLIAFLDEFPELKANEDERLHRKIDPCQEAVQILTQHSSKGLEFEIVFVLGLIKKSPAPDPFLPQNTSFPPTLVPILDREDPRYILHCQEIDAEKMRQLYVAFTRAKYRLYVATTTPQHTPLYGYASPMEIFLAKIAQPQCAYAELYERIHQADDSSFYTWLETHKSSLKISYSLGQTQSSISVPKIKPQETELIVPPAIEIFHTKIPIHSFTSLSKQFGHKGDLLEQPPHDFNALIKNAHTLPAGNTTGILLHALLENFPFEQIQNYTSSIEILPFVAPYTTGTPFHEWNEVLAQILFNTLKLPLPFNTDLVSLETIPSHQMFREIEFLYPYEEDLFALNLSKSFIKGVIDLVFMHQGKYYIVDWKSNWLGSSHEAYQEDNLRKSMHDQGYFLQTSIYIESLKRYLNIYDPQDFQQIFGGIYYIFLRGLERKENQLHGFFANQWEGEPS